MVRSGVVMGLNMESGGTKKAGVVICPKKPSWFFRFCSPLFLFFYRTPTLVEESCRSVDGPFVSCKI
ncbi:hypothetical protein Hanom_Chr09g00848301 [Helianthus anomalus]